MSVSTVCGRQRRDTVVRDKREAHLNRFPRVLLYFMAVDWPLFTRRPFLRALARAGRKYRTAVVAVNRPLCPISTPLKKPKRLGCLFGRARLEAVDDNLYLYSPRYFVHDRIARRLPLLEASNLAALRYGVGKLLKRLSLQEPHPIVWFNYPQQGYLAKLIDGSFSVFELYDYLSDIYGRQSPEINRLEKGLRERADLLLTTSRKLHDAYGAHYRRSLRFGNGLDRATFDRLSRPDVETIPEVVAIRSPRIGYAGMISERLDWELITSLAESSPRYSFVFVGPVADPALRASLNRRDNIHFLGPYGRESMAAVLKSFDIGIMPYRDTPFFEYLNPLKFYEMAAAGLPMVSSNIEELKQYPRELVRVVPNDPALWREALGEQLARNRSNVCSIGRETAARFIWEDMAESLLDSIAEMIRGRRPNDHRVT